MRSRILLAALLALFVAALTGGATAQTGGDVVLIIRGDEPQDTIQRLVDSLRRDGRTVTIRLTEQAAAPAPVAAASPAPARATPASGPSSGATLFDNFVLGVQRGFSGIRFLPQLGADFAANWQRIENSASTIGAIGLIVVAPGIAIAASLALGLALRSWWQSAHAGPGLNFLQRLRRSGVRLIGDLAGLVAFVLVARFAIDGLLPADDLARTVANAMAAGLMFFALYVIVGRFLLAPHDPASRLLPLPRATRHFAILTAYGAAGQVVLVSVSKTDELSGFCSTRVVRKVRRLFWRRRCDGQRCYGRCSCGDLKKRMSATSADG